ncbi:MAG: phenylalanine--tRNA ligase subunit alpha [Acidobacteriota bacterium]
MKEELQKIKELFLEEVKKISSEKGLFDIKVKYLGRKSGLLTEKIKEFGKLSPAEKPEVGRLLNEIKSLITLGIEEKKKGLLEISRERKQKKGVDLTLPGYFPAAGHYHPISQVSKLIAETFIEMGYSVEEGPDIEDDFHNFKALNIPKDHPARDMQDTFYINQQLLLRTHTSPVQIRTMQKYKPPLKFIAPGKCYRRDFDITHTPMFHQVEGLCVDRAISMADLKGTTDYFCRRIFGEEVRLRFRPSYFPFVEPGAEVDISCTVCGGAGCRSCKMSGWLEIMGAGIVHPAVFEAVGYDSRKYTGFAFGMGIERITMLKFGIEDIRLFFENDIRFLAQF